MSVCWSAVCVLVACSLLCAGCWFVVCFGLFVVCRLLYGCVLCILLLFDCCTLCAACCLVVCCLMFDV